MLTILLAGSVGVFTGNACCYWRLGSWDELREGKLEEVFVIHCFWGQKGMRNPGRFLATELLMKLGSLYLRRSRRGVSAFRLLVALGTTAPGLSKSTFWSFSLEQSNKSEKGGYEEMVCGIHRNCGEG